jgi:hypothetical protein
MPIQESIRHYDQGTIEPASLCAEDGLKSRHVNATTHDAALATNHSDDRAPFPSHSDDRGRL